MPAAKSTPTSVRLSEDTRERIALLSRWWGPVAPLGITDVIAEAVRRAVAAGPHAAGPEPPAARTPRRARKS